jgi:predicted DNA-binding antitoxin AbrB/MazE fold protein
MSQEFDAIFEGGVFRPLEPVDLPDHSKVHLHVREAADQTADSTDDERTRQRSALSELVAWVESQPAQSRDSMSARDHDQLLYGWPK